MEDNKCIVKNCKRTSANLFCSPSDEQLLQKWKEIVDTENEIFFICDNHFKLQDIYMEKCLESSAVPHIDVIEKKNDKYKDSCGMCLKNLGENSGLQISQQKSENFKNITGFRPMSQQICESCDSFLQIYHEFRTEIKEKHKILQQQNDPQSDDDCVMVDAPKCSEKEIPYPKLPPDVISKIVSSKEIKTLFRCKHCYFKTIDRTELINHIDEIHCFPCKNCPFISSNNPLLTLHINKFHTKDPNSIVCGICDARFDKKHQIDRHYMELHSFRHINYFMCFYCKANCTTDDDLVLHYEKFHAAGKTTASDQINNTKLQLALLIGNKKKVSGDAKAKNYREIMNKIKPNVTIKKVCTEPAKIKKKITMKRDYDGIPLNTPIKIPNAADFPTTSKSKLTITEVTIVSKNDGFGTDSDEKDEYQVEVEDDAVSLSDSDVELISVTTSKKKPVVAAKKNPGGSLKDVSEEKLNNSKFRCFSCNQYFENVAALLDHRMKVHAEKPKIYQQELNYYPRQPRKLSDEKALCAICNVSILQRNMRKHMQLCHEEKQFLCHVCSKVFADSTRFRYHMMQHEPEVMFQCDMCEKSFVSKGLVRKHIDRAHLKIPHVKGQCTICKKKFLKRIKDGKNVIEHHMNKYHPNGKDEGYRVNEETNFFDCEKCGASYYDLYTFTKHTCEKGAKQIRCLDCMTPCGSLESLEKHKVTKCRKINPFTNSISLKLLESYKNRDTQYPPPSYNFPPQNYQFPF